MFFRFFKDYVGAAVAVAGLMACGQPRVLDAPPSTRALWGAPRAHDADHELVGRLAELRSDHRARRQEAWKIVERVLAGVIASRDVQAQMPYWLTLNDREDIRRLARYYKKIQPSPDAMHLIHEANARHLWNIPIWTEARFADWLQKLSTPEKLAGAFGISRALYSNELVNHLLLNAPKVINCKTTVAQHDAADRAATDNFTLCLDHEFPASALAVKSSWQRVGPGRALPIYDTDVDSLARRAAEDSWDRPDRFATEVSSDEIFSMELGDGARFQLTGLHIMSKELREWYWITLWWSDDPSTDFGKDRPTDGIVGDGLWSHYKMCTVVDYEDAETESGHSWCSNPYLEKGKGNFSTNCIGCHQHAGTEIAQADILTRRAGKKRWSLNKIRKNFPTDYLWGVRAVPDQLDLIFQNEGLSGGR